MGMRNRDLVDAVARYLAGCVVPPHWFGPQLTSMCRRWSQITRVKMRRTTPHPRPWEGPILSFDGLFRGVDRDESPEVTIVEDADGRFWLGTARQHADREYANVVRAAADKVRDG
jgi:hypothetical protein